MKNLFTKTGLLLVLLLLIGSKTFAQDPDPFVMTDFEPDGPGANLNTNPPPVGWNWNGSGEPTIAANPDKSGINLSNTVMYCVRSLTDVAWAGPKIDPEWGTAFVDTWGGPIAGYSYMHIKMYCNQVTKPQVNVQVGGGDVDAVEGTEIIPYTWIDVVFDISEYTMDRIIIMIDQSDELTQASEVYLDDIILTNNLNPITTGIHNTKGSDVTVFAVNGILHVSGTNDAVAVYNALGQTVYQNMSAENLSVELANGIYIVKAGATVKKILVQ